MNTREASKQNWTGDNTNEHINIGSLQRIADACEAMSKNYIALLRQVECYRTEAEQGRTREARLSRQVRALKGVITKLKSQSDQGARL